MKVSSALVGIALVFALAACGGGSGNQSTSGASAAPAASPAVVATSAPATTAPAGTVSALPVYPGATKMAMQMDGPATACGHKMTISMYRVPGGDADTIASWYAGKMDGATQIKNDATYGSIHAHHVMVISGDGSEGATVIANTYPPAMAKMMAKSQNGGTQLALTTYDPAFTHDEIDLYSRAASGDAAAKAQAMAAFKTKCGSGFKLGM